MRISDLRFVSEPQAILPKPATGTQPLDQFKRYLNGAQLRHQQGVAYLRFAMDRQGKVLSASIEKRSGFDLLDEETLALIRRAEPLPPPPSELPRPGANDR